MFFVCDVDSEDVVYVKGLFSEVGEAKMFGKKLCGRRGVDTIYVYHMPLNDKVFYDRSNLVGHWEKESHLGGGSRTYTVGWYDCDDYAPHLIEEKLDIADELAYCIMNRDPVAMDLVRDVLGRQDL
jgi:hypothetical protein